MPKFKVANKLFRVEFGSFSKHNFVVSHGKAKTTGILQYINHPDLKNRFMANFSLSPQQAEELKSKIIDEALKLNERRKKK